MIIKEGRAVFEGVAIGKLSVFKKSEQTVKREKVEDVEADLSLTKEFLAMGYDELSVSPGRILPLRKVVLETNVSEYKEEKGYK
jgi:phosphotransferase system enzyme I (PtsI)